MGQFVCLNVAFCAQLNTQYPKALIPSGERGDYFYRNLNKYKTVEFRLLATLLLIRLVLCNSVQGCRDVG
jgi:hypothetical protein